MFEEDYQGLTLPKFLILSIIIYVSVVLYEDGALGLIKLLAIQIPFMLVIGVPILSYSNLSQEVSIGDPNTARWRVLYTLKIIFYALVFTPFGADIYDVARTGQQASFRRKCMFTALVLAVVLPIIVFRVGGLGMEEMRYAIKVPTIMLKDCRNIIGEVPQLWKLWRVVGMYRQDDSLDGLFDSH